LDKKKGITTVQTNSEIMFNCNFCEIGHDATIQYIKVLNGRHIKNEGKCCSIL